ncbi:uncharacterized protein LOC127569059 isoform X2 [Pristis pectinata]|uniref:uncharacterized protein LOC127569059 isoform X2 n=1 Tax=Pristis pectinata TaxID=685728 RepID=UPI00223E253E|nr:uncharacterized protein LOC127569059 isoform X2 [Pristis pectinata]
MGERDLDSALLANGWKFRMVMERIFEKYSQPFEDDLIINLEDMTFDTETGWKPWCPVDLNFHLPRKRSKNNTKKKSGKLYEADVNPEQSDKLCETDVSQAQAEKLYETDISQELSTCPLSQVDHTTEVLKDGQFTESASKLQTSISMGDMNVGDKYEIDVDMLATSNSNLGSQVVVECVGRTKDNPLITFTPTSKLKIGLSDIYHDCSDGFQDITSKELNHSSKLHHDDKNNSNIVALSSSQILVKPLCVPSSTEVYWHKFDDSGCDGMNLGETASTCSNQTSMKSHDDSSGLSDTTLIDIYPSMVASMSDLLDRTYKTEAASRLIKHYRRLQFNVCKSKTNTTQNGIKIKVRKDAQKLKKLKYHSMKLKACAGTKQVQDKAISPSYKTAQENLEGEFTLTANAPSRTVLQTNSTSETECSKFGNLYDDSSFCQPLPLSPCNPQTPIAVANCCKTRKISVHNVSPLNGSTLPKLHALTNSGSLKSLSLKSNMAMVELASSRIIVSHLQNAEQCPLNNSTITQPDVVANCSRSPFGRLLCSANNSYSNEGYKRRHSFSSASVPAKFHSVQSLLKTKVKEMDAFETVYQSLVRNEFSLSATVAHPSVLNVHSIPRRERTSVSSITCSPSQLSRKRAACIDQARETSRLPLKKFRSFSESSSSNQNSQEVLVLNTILQKQDYHCTQRSGFHSPRSKQDREKIAADVFIKNEDNRLYANSATVLPVINSSGNTVSLCLSPRLRNRVYILG